MTLHHEIWEYFRYQNDLARLRIPREQASFISESAISKAKTRPGEKILFLIGTDDLSANEEKLLKKIEVSIHPVKVKILNFENMDQLVEDLSESDLSEIESVITFGLRDVFAQESLLYQQNSLTKWISENVEKKRVFLHSCSLDQLQASASEKQQLWNFLKNAKAQIEHRKT